MTGDRRSGGPPPTRRVLYPGSFDPIHLGHLDVIEQAAELFGTVVVAIMYNPSKPSGTFSADRRAELAREVVAGFDGVTVELHTGLAVQAADRANVDFIVKGLRTAGDFEIEQQMAQNNHAVTGVRTVFVPCRPDLGYISSRFVREIAKYGGEIGHLVPPAVANALRTVFDESDGSGS
jgi:pantetheine-phosphate adenylyltransferase